MLLLTMPHTWGRGMGHARGHVVDDAASYMGGVWGMLGAMLLLTLCVLYRAVPGMVTVQGDLHDAVVGRTVVQRDVHDVVPGEPPFGGKCRSGSYAYP